MSTIASDLRTQSDELRRQADRLDAIAASIDAGELSPDAFFGNAKAREIVSSICNELRVSVALVLSRDRHDDVVVCRDICTHAVHQLLGLSQNALARVLCRADHSVCNYALRRVRERRQVDHNFSALLDRGMKAAHAAAARIDSLAA